jgi:hypothetical protein
MIKTLSPLCTVIALLGILYGSVSAQTAADSAGIRSAALDYIEGWYTADARRMEQALHPALAKRIVEIDPKSHNSVLGQMGAKELIQNTRAGGGKGAKRRQTDVSILDIYQGAASAKIIAGDWVDYLHLARWNGRWVIVNVLWEWKPLEARASR